MLMGLLAVSIVSPMFAMDAAQVPAAGQDGAQNEERSLANRVVYCVPDAIDGFVDLMPDSSVKEKYQEYIDEDSGLGYRCGARTAVVAATATVLGITYKAVQGVYNWWTAKPEEVQEEVQEDVQEEVVVETPAPKVVAPAPKMTAREQRMIQRNIVRNAMLASRRRK